ncbi:hypothetical protein PS15m_010588 [Mucor circinelloides]
MDSYSLQPAAMIHGETDKEDNVLIHKNYALVIRKWIKTGRVGNTPKEAKSRRFTSIYNHGGNFV